MLLKACLNGGRTRADHPACPVTPAELARDAVAAVAAGAGALHVHPRDATGAESLAPGDVAAAVAALRDAVAVPVGVTTGAWILPDVADRLRAIAAWDVLPDFASVNVHEPGAGEVARSLLDRGVGVEAGVWDEAAAGLLANGGLAVRCLRILLEPQATSVAGALATADAIERRLASAADGVPRLLHGQDGTAWPVLDWAGPRGYDLRIGLEDTVTGPGGQPVAGNAELVAIAAARRQP